MNTLNIVPPTDHVDVPYTVIAGVSLDSSDDETLRQAALLAGASDGGLHLCHCAGEPQENSAADQELLSRAKSTLLRWSTTRIQDPAVAGRTVLHTALGSPADVLIQLATDLEADVIVVGRAKRGAFRQLVAKPVALQLAQWAPCPTWIAAAKDYAGLGKAPAVEQPVVPSNADRGWSNTGAPSLRLSTRLIPDPSTNSRPAPG